MAFPLPEHLPRAGFSHDGSAFGSSSSNAEPFLNIIASTPAKAFKAATASIWVRDIDQAINTTKDNIRSRVQADVGLFEHQLESSVQAQTRLTSLSRSVEDLEESLNDPRNGVLPSLLKVLASHSELAQWSSDVQARKAALDHLRRLRDVFQETTSLEREGRLPEAVTSLRAVKDLLDTAPEPLSKAKVFGEAKRRFRTVEDSLQEKIGSAYGELIAFDTSLRIKQSVLVEGSTNVVQIEPLLASISSDILAAKLVSLRKDLLAKLIVPALSTAGYITVSEFGPSSFAASLTTETQPAVLQGLNHLIKTLQRSFVVALPSFHRASFPASLYQPIAQAILSNLLQSSMPSNLSEIPPYLRLVNMAVELEQEITNMGFTCGRGRLVQEWADDVGGHYEKRRRQNIITTARELIEDVHGTEVGVGIRIEVQESELLQASEESSPSSRVINNNYSGDNEKSAWGFDDESSPSQRQQQDGQEGDGDDGWGFDDDAEPQGPLSLRDDESSSGAPSSAAESTPGDGWGWEDDGPAEPEPSAFSSVAARPARGLEKRSGARSTNANSAVSGATFGSSKQPSHLTSPSTVTNVRRSPETFLISSRATKILAVAKRCLDNGKQIMDSKVFPEHTPSRGSLLLSTSAAILDLYRALYPAAHAPDLSMITNQDEFVLKTAECLQFSNDCRYLADQLQWLISIPDYEQVQDKLRDSQDRMKSASALTLQQTLDEGVRRVLNSLKGTHGFIDTGDEMRIPGYRNALEQARDEIETIAVKWHTVLTKSAYLHALGVIVDRSLAKVVADIIDLHDIPEEESHRLRSLLEVLAPLEALFMDEEISTVVLHVPSWLKFSYLSELLEASMADISYLFDEGALIDFSTDELVSLIRGLFADTPLRARTIEKISFGHPVHD